MTNKQLNRLAVLAQGGCQESLWMIRAHFQSYIHNLSNLNWWRISNEERFEESCFTRITEAIRKYNPNKGNFAGQVHFRIRRLLYQHIERYPVRLESLDDFDEGRDETRVSDVIDDLAVVDAEYLANEKIARLAAGDPRKMAILTAWTYECLSDTDTAAFLAQRYGGKTETYRKRISRLRTACQTALADAI